MSEDCIKNLRRAYGGTQTASISLPLEIDAWSLDTWPGPVKALTTDLNYVEGVEKADT
ncbi:hypothetical protein FF38_08290 [Lucilia cuprina]|uniref:Uncharacterized protein n=1 Tax=Lucilia cuprina TaxID=7375 RepID=A0A0L0CNN3_LUCCU|nr:hypothetical protein FF38_08290 [Lucilia cuprina]